MAKVSGCEGQERSRPLLFRWLPLTPAEERGGALAATLTPEQTPNL
jgi:hypothetical protein